MPRIFASAPTEDDPAPNTRSRAALRAASVDQLNQSLARRARSPASSRSPSPAPPWQSFFPPVFPSSSNMDAQGDAFRAMAETAAAAAAAQASVQTVQALQNLQLGKRKPELPEFDVKHIDIWIRRTEAAYICAGITLAKEKFAFLESKISVEFDPTINEFLFGDPTEANWTDFWHTFGLHMGRHDAKKPPQSLMAPGEMGAAQHNYSPALRSGQAK